MNKKILLTQIENIRESLGNRFPKIKQSAEKIERVTERNYYHGLVGFLNEFRNYLDFDKVKGIYEQVEKFYSENKIRFNLESAKYNLSQSTTRLNESVIPKIDSILESSDEDLEKMIKLKLSSYSFMPDVRGVLSLVEEKEAEDYEPTEEEEEEFDEDDVVYELKSGLQKTNSTSHLKEQNYIHRMLKMTSSMDSLLVAENIARDLQGISTDHVLYDLFVTCNEMVSSRPTQLLIKKLQHKMQNNKNSGLYTRPIKVLESVSQKSEQELENNVINELREFTWIPEIKSTIQGIRSLRTQKINEDTVNVNTKFECPIVPIVENTVYLGNDLYFSVDENEAHKVDPSKLSKETRELLNQIHEAITLFNYNEAEDVFEFKGENNNDLAFSIDEEKGIQLEVNDQVFESENFKKLSAILPENRIPSRIVEALNTLTSIENVENMIVEFDKAIVVGPADDKLYVINFGNLFVNEKEFTSGDEVVDYIKERYNVNISPFVVEHLDENKQANYKVNKQVKKLTEVVEFYKQQIEKVTEAIQSPDVTNESELLQLRVKLKKGLQDAKNELAKYSTVQGYLKDHIWSEFVAEAEETEEEEVQGDFETEDELKEYMESEIAEMSDEELSEEEAEEAMNKALEEYKSNKGYTKVDASKCIHEKVKK